MERRVGTGGVEGGRLFGLWKHVQRGCFIHYKKIGSILLVKLNCQKNDPLCGSFFDSESLLVYRALPYTLINLNLS
jgi:hypothetical protein